MSAQTVSRRVAVTGLASAFAGLAFGQVVDDSVTLEYARKELEAGKATLIDIREPQEHATGVAKGARLLPMRQLAGRVSEIPNDPKTPVLLICNT
ncbi:MAG: rhodanese-like domain-containing protein, partial [Rhodoferax sp.]|nr:rhodanese-like domain-containing protein [Rhodoferax sp.]